jgi:hypothetical protein
MYEKIGEKICFESDLCVLSCNERNERICRTIPHHKTHKFTLSPPQYRTMKTFQTLAIFFAAIIACTSAFSTPSPKTSFKPAAVVPTVEAKAAENKNAAAIAAFATAMAPFAAHAEGAVDEATVIGYGAGLVACVVSLAVGFSIGYGTLVKL